MHADKIVHFLNKTIGSIKADTGNPAFKIPEKALIVLPGYIGDAILMTPLVRNIKHNFPKSTVIDVICNKATYNLLETLSYFDNIYINEIDVKDKNSFLKKNNYDTVFLFNLPVSWAYASYKADIEQRISFNLERIGIENHLIWQKLITHPVKSTPINDKKPQWRVYLDILNDLGLKIFDEHLEIKLTDNDLKKAEKIAKNIKSPLVMIHVTSGSPGKHWPIKNWIKVVNHLKKKFNYSFISTGTTAEEKIYQDLEEKTGVKIHNFCGKTSIRETIALCKHLDLIITLDSAPAHFGAVVNTKNIIVIYGATNETQWKPYSEVSNVEQIYIDLPCRPCLTRFCHHKNCLNKITPNQVIKAINKIPKLD